MEAFDGGHFATLLGPFEAVDNDHWTTLHPHQPTGEEGSDGLEPTGRQSRDGQGGGVEEVQQSVVAGIDQTEAANQAGHPGEVGPQAQGSQGRGQPEEG